VPSLHLHNFFGPDQYRSLAARVSENLAENAPTELILIVLSFFEKKQPNLAELCRIRTRI